MGIEIVILCGIILALFYLGVYFRSRKKPIVAFFHPNCMDCGGGEKVLWAAVDALKDMDLAIYAENADYEAAKKKLRNQFEMEIPEKLQFINVGPAEFIRPDRFKRFTLILQAVHSIIYVIKCLLREVPAVVIDTTGAPFAAPVWKYLGGCTVIFYTHYPFISTDMLADVKEKRESVNNSEEMTKSPLKTKIKTIYYRILCWIYGKTGKAVDVSLVNSSWTANHIKTIYGRPPHIVYPPCDCRVFSQFPLDGREKELIVSVGQFRPEKNYPLQLDIMEKLKETNPNAKLVIVGGVRNQGDQKLFDQLQKRINEKHLNVELKPNLPYEELKQLLRKADVGLHTMRNEHFGICVVEYIAAGLIPMAHKSAGPLMDIVRDENYLGETADEYVQKLRSAFSDNTNTRIRFREQADTFSYEYFVERFRAQVERSIQRATRRL